MRNWFPILLLSILSNFALSNDGHTDTWICISEDSTGFYFKDGKWGRAVFNISEDKFIIRPIKKSDGRRYFNDKAHPYGVFVLGENRPSKRCSADEDIVCKLGIGDLFFSPKSGRFIRIYAEGYWDGADNNDNTPNITRGRCSKI